jgi:hypothetical protein
MGFDNIDNMALTAWVAGAVTLVFGILALPGIDKRMHRTPIAHWEPLGTPKDPTGGRPALPQGACRSRGSRQARPPDWARPPDTAGAAHDHLPRERFRT